MTEDKELKDGMKDCPHCGARPFVMVSGIRMNFYRVVCRKDCTNLLESRQEAIDAWNRRV